MGDESPNRRQGWARDFGVIVGAASAVVGVALLSLPAALIIGGLAIAAICIVLEGQR